MAIAIASHIESKLVIVRSCLVQIKDWHEFRADLVEDLSPALQEHIFDRYIKCFELLSATLEELDDDLRLIILPLLSGSSMRVRRRK